MHLHSDVDIEVCEAIISRHNRKMFQSCILYQYTVLLVHSVSNVKWR